MYSLNQFYDLNLPRLPSYVPINSFITNALVSTAVTTQLLSSNVLRAAPFVISSKTTINRLVFSVTTAGSTNSATIVGLYSNKILSIGDDYPYQLLASSGVQDSAAATVKTTDITPVILNPGIYWVAYNCNEVGTEPTLRGVNQGALFALGVDAGLGTNTQQCIISIAKTYDGTLPATFPSGATLVSNTSIPILAMRRSA
ncbi:MAG: hypothetical protein HC836_44995 [Richelia sp. RM2_1_2]|nr:hypothetical protein [Richelia sp. RM2_1_2]